MKYSKFYNLYILYVLLMGLFLSLCIFTYNNFFLPNKKIVTYFYYSPLETKLIAERRVIPRKSKETIDERVFSFLEIYFNGPKTTVLRSPVKNGVQVLNTIFKNGDIYIHLNREYILLTDKDSEEILLNGILKSLKENFSSINKVYITAGDTAFSFLHSNISYLNGFFLKPQILIPRDKPFKIILKNKKRI